MLTSSLLKCIGTLDFDICKVDEGERETNTEKRINNQTTLWKWKDKISLRVRAKDSAGWAHSEAAVAYISVALSETKIFFMDFTEVSLTDPFMAMFIAA